ncbi:MIF-like protein mif-2 [Paramacrobiotus metropolitanus]|uniref:MIF-like protein mif-2 n=1 Tax=Paramacrobiotus metropolitanus TaxID=2943436 RepID=UPI0024462D72|nr:MIF-like protein mif-2 [Paramacrobiotus metropolitanus]
MPTLQINTNVTVDKIPKEFNREVTDFLSSLMEMDPKFFTVFVNAGQLITNGGTHEPCGFASLWFIGSFFGNVSEKHNKALFDFVQQKLGIAPNRFAIFYHDMPPAAVGYDGKTFAGTPRPS